MLPNIDFENGLSLNGHKWIIEPTDSYEVERIMRMHRLPEFIARLLHSRRVKAESVPNFLFPNLRRDFPDPFSLKDMRKAAEFLAAAIFDGRKIAVFGDFDVDGATSTALMVRFFRALGQNIPFVIPDRVSDGYGPNINALKKLRADGTDIVIMADCGTTAHSVVEQGRSIGLEIIIVDHHETEGSLPEANFVINPKRKDDHSGLDMLAAAGVCFLLCVAVNNVLKKENYYSQNNILEPDLKSFIELVGLGTVCDMVPLSGPNRLFVRRGFEQMHNTGITGLKTLIEVSGISGDITPYHAGFALGPRINAGSRVNRADIGARLLATDDKEEAMALSWQLQDCNEKRKSIQNEMMARANNAVLAGNFQNNHGIVVSDPDGHPGLGGLVAGRLKDKYGLPACVITFACDDDGNIEGRGSGRSIPGVNIAKIFMEAREEGLLTKGGGHEMAGGFTINKNKINDFRSFFDKKVEQHLNSEKPVQETRIDGLITAGGLQSDFIKLINDHVGPFGQGNPEPVFLFPNARVYQADIVGQDHVRCFLGDREGGKRIKSIAFRAADTPLGQALLQKPSVSDLHLVGQLKLDTWQGAESAEIHIADGMHATAASALKIAAE